MLESRNDPALSPLLVQLLKGVLEREQHAQLWQDLLRLQAASADYLGVIGLTLFVDEAEGYAFLKQRRYEEGEAAIPKLIAGRPLGFHVSLLLVLLRKKLVEADAGGGELRVILTLDQLVEMLRVYMPDAANEAKQEDAIARHVAKVVELGFLRELKGQPNTFEVRRLLRAFIDADWLASFEAKLEEAQEHDAADA